MSASVAVWSSQNRGSRSGTCSSIERFQSSPGSRPTARSAAWIALLSSSQSSWRAVRGAGSPLTIRSGLKCQLALPHPESRVRTARTSPPAGAAQPSTTTWTSATRAPRPRRGLAEGLAHEHRPARGQLAGGTGNVDPLGDAPRVLGQGSFECAHVSRPADARRDRSAARRRGRRHGRCTGAGRHRGRTGRAARDCRGRARRPPPPPRRPPARRRRLGPRQRAAASLQRTLRPAPRRGAPSAAQGLLARRSIAPSGRELAPSARSRAPRVPWALTRASTNAPTSRRAELPRPSRPGDRR